MAATRKRVPEVQNQDVDQLKSIFGTSMPGMDQKARISENRGDTAKPVQPRQTVQQIQTNQPPLTTGPVQTFQAAAPVQDSSVITEEKKEVSDTTVGIRMTSAKKREMKAYFIQHGTTMSQGVIDAFTLLRKLEEKGLASYKDGLLECDI